MRINANTVYHVCKPLAESPINIFKTGSSAGARLANLCVALALLCTGAFIPVGAAYLYSKHIVDLKSKDIENILHPAVIATAEKTDTTAKASFNKDDLGQDVLADKLVELVLSGIPDREEQFVRGFKALTFEAQKDLFQKAIDNDCLESTLDLIPQDTQRLNLVSYSSTQELMNEFPFSGVAKSSTKNAYIITKFLTSGDGGFTDLNEVCLDFRHGSPVNEATLQYLSNQPDQAYEDNDFGKKRASEMDFSNPDILIRATTYNVSNALKFLEDRVQKRPENSTHSDVIMLDGYTRTFIEKGIESSNTYGSSSSGVTWAEASHILTNFVLGKTSGRDATEQQKDTVANILGGAKDVANPNTAPEGCSKPDDYKAFKQKVIDEQAKGTKANPNPGYYFGLDNNDPASVKKAYLKLASVIHPDKFPNLTEDSAGKKEVVALFQCMKALNEIVNPPTTT